MSKTNHRMKNADQVQSIQRMKRKMRDQRSKEERHMADLCHLLRGQDVREIVSVDEIEHEEKA